MIIRMNSLIRGHSGVRLAGFLFFFGRRVLNMQYRWELIEKINELVAANVTPFVPLRGSISASGGQFTSYFFSPADAFS
jgi:phenylalanine ammonia-lyase